MSTEIMSAFKYRIVENNYTRLLNYEYKIENINEENDWYGIKQSVIDWAYGSSFDPEEDGFSVLAEHLVEEKNRYNAIDLSDEFVYVDIYDIDSKIIYHLTVYAQIRYNFEAEIDTMTSLL